MDKPDCSIIDSKLADKSLFDVDRADNKPTSHQSIAYANRYCEWPNVSVSEQHDDGGRSTTEQPISQRPTSQRPISQVDEKRWLQLDSNEMNQQNSLAGQASESSTKFDKVANLPYMIRSKVNVPSFEAHRQLFEKRISDWSRRIADENRVLTKKAFNQVARTNGSHSNGKNNDEFVELHNRSNEGSNVQSNERSNGRSNDVHNDEYCQCVERLNGLDQENRLDNASHLNGGDRSEAFEDSGRKVLKDDLNERTISSALNKVNDDNKRFEENSDKHTTVIRMFDKQLCTPDESLDEKRDGHRLADETGYCQCDRGTDYESKDRPNDECWRFASNWLRINHMKGQKNVKNHIGDHERLEDHKLSEIDEKRSARSDELSSQFRLSFKPNSKRKDDRSMDSLTFARRTDRASSLRRIQDPNPKQTNRRNENNEETSKNKNTQTNATSRCDRSTQTEDRKRSAARYRPIPVQNHLTARMIDEILVSRSQPR